MCAFMYLRNNGVFANSIHQFRSTVLREFVALVPTAAQLISSSSSTDAPAATAPTATATTASTTIHTQTAAAATTDDVDDYNPDADDNDGHDNGNDESPFPDLVDGRFAADPAAWRGQSNSRTTAPAAAASAATAVVAAPPTLPIIAPVAASTSSGAQQTNTRGTFCISLSSPAARRRSVRCLRRTQASFRILTHAVGRENQRLSVQPVHTGSQGRTAETSCSSCKHRRHSRSQRPSHPF